MPVCAEVVVTNGFVPVKRRRVTKIFGLGMLVADLKVGEEEEKEEGEGDAPKAESAAQRYSRLLDRWEDFADYSSSVSGCLDRAATPVEIWISAKCRVQVEQAINFCKYGQTFIPNLLALLPCFPYFHTRRTERECPQLAELTFPEVEEADEEPRLPGQPANVVSTLRRDHHTYAQAKELRQRLVDGGFGEEVDFRSRIIISGRYELFYLPNMRENTETSQFKKKAH